MRFNSLDLRQFRCGRDCAPENLRAKRQHVTPCFIHFCEKVGDALQGFNRSGRYVALLASFLI